MLALVVALEGSMVLGRAWLCARANLEAAPYWSALMALFVGGCGLPFVSGEVTLTGTDDWRWVVTRSQELAVVHANGRSGAGDFTQPPTLNEAGAHFLHRDGRPVTVVAGPVAGEVPGPAPVPESAPPA